MRVAILAHGGFPDRAKTAQGILRYGDGEVVAVLDRDRAGDRVREYVPDVQDAPIVESMAAVEDVDALVIGVAPIGGGFTDDWRPDVRAALEQGCDLVSGLHTFLADDEEFSRLAADHGCEIWDVRKPPADLTVSEGRAGEVDATVICTVGTDCSVGKMTTTMELVAGLRESGHDAAVIPTGQTGIVIEGWGMPVDRVISDFAAGAVERMICEKGDDHDYLVVEGQGSIVHPAYSAVTCGILHGAMADALVCCHEAGRDVVYGYESFDLPPIETYVDLYESLADPVSPASVVGGAIDTSALSQEAAQAAIERYETALSAPATDPIRDGVDPLVEVLT